jgi:hypothetical protein
VDLLQEKRVEQIPNSTVFVEYLKGCSTIPDLVELGEITHHCH